MTEDDMELKVPLSQLLEVEDLRENFEVGRYLTAVTIRSRYGMNV
jgi:hypothetical protein